VLGDRGPGSRIVLRQARAPFRVPDDRGTELGVGGEPGPVGGTGQQRDEPQPLLCCDRQPDVLVEHVLIPAARLRVFGRAAHHLAPPGRRVRAMLSSDGPAEHGTDEIILFHEIVEQVQPPLERVLAATPLEDRRRLIRLSGHGQDDSRSDPRAMSARVAWPKCRGVAAAPCRG
jgi:hypothetical protein